MDSATLHLQTWQIVGLGVVQAVALSVIGGFLAWVMARQAAKTKAAEKQQDWDRQDEVAARVEAAAKQTATAAKLLLESQNATVAATEKVAELALETNTKLTEQLDMVISDTKKIHTLVNSDMTAARTAERAALKLLVIALRRGTRVLNEEEQDEVVRVEKRIAELDQILADRLEAQRQVDLQTDAGQ